MTCISQKVSTLLCYGWLAYGLLASAMFLMRWMWRNLLPWGYRRSKNLQPAALMAVHVVRSKYEGATPSIGCGLWDNIKTQQRKNSYTSTCTLWLVWVPAPSQPVRHGWRWSYGSSWTFQWRYTTYSHSMDQIIKCPWSQLLLNPNRWRWSQPQWSITRTILLHIVSWRWRSLWPSFVESCLFSLWCVLFQLYFFLAWYVSSKLFAIPV